jgi:hypothetical protein
MLHRCVRHREPIIAQAPPHEDADHDWPRADAGGDGAAVWNTATIRRLHARRWRRRWYAFETPRWWLLGAVVLLHVVFALIAQRSLHTSLVPPAAADDTPLQVRFVSVQLAPAPPPPPPPPTRRQAQARPAAAAAPAPAPAPSRTATAAAPASPPPLRLYTTDGRIRLPAAAASSKPAVAGNLQGDTHVMRGYDPLHYEPTPFEPYFPPIDESAGGAVVRRVVDTVVKTKDIDLPRGVHLKCKTVLGIPTPDCMVPPPTVSPKAGDERLNMAPAKPLAAPAAASSAPSVATCIKLYRDGKPLPWGCPVDTPTRAVDAELKEKARRGGGR